MFLFLHLDNCILLKLDIRQPIISFCMFCNLQHWLFWNMCFSWYTLYFWLWRLSIVLLCAHSSAHSLDYPICKTKYCWLSVDAQFHDGVTDVPWTVSYNKAATTSYINYCHIVTLGVPKIQRQQSLTLQWRTVSACDRECAAIFFNSKESQYFVYEWLQPIATNVTQDGQVKIINAPLTLILRMRQWPCWILFCQERVPVRWLWIAATRSLSKYRTYKSKHRWCSVDAYFHDGVGSLIQLFWTLKAANTSFMNGCNQSPLRLPKMNRKKSLTLHWLWFSEWGSDRVFYSFAKRGCQYVG